MPDIKLKQSKRAGKFYIADYAYMSFIKPADNVIDVNHTVVNPEHRGEGLAQDLYRYMIGYARENKLKVIPSCSFVDKMFIDNPDDRGLLA